jgi:hypothetical protein
MRRLRATTRIPRLPQPVFNNDLREVIEPQRQFEASRRRGTTCSPFALDDEASRVWRRPQRDVGGTDCENGRGTGCGAHDEPFAVLRNLGLS